MKDLRRHPKTLPEAVEMIEAVRMLGGGANLYDMTNANPSHWLLEIFKMPKNDWTEGQEEACE
jgi:hypothetical protein